MRTSHQHAAILLQLAFSLSGILVIPLGIAPSASAQVHDSNQQLIDRLVLERAAVLASLEQRNEEREGALLIHLSARDRQIRLALASTRTTQSETARLNSELTSLLDQRRAALEGLAAIDRPFEADVRAYRQQVTSIANSPDPRRRVALERYANGDRTGALAVLVEIQEAETRAVAAGWREIGALTLDMRDRGERSTADLIAVLEQVTRLDPSDHWDWVQLSRAYLMVERLNDAEYASQQAANTADDENKRGGALLELANVQRNRLNNAAAQRNYQEALDIFQREVADNPDSTYLQRSLSVAEFRVGEMYEIATPAARAHFEASLEAALRAVELSPNHLTLLRHVSMNYFRIGEIQFQGRL